MVKTILSQITLIALLAVSTATACLAHDMIPAPWRGTTGATYQEWRFNTSANPAAPENVSNIYGSCGAVMNVGPFGEGWVSQLPGFGNQSGFWDLGSAGTIGFSVASNPLPPVGTKGWVSVQVTYFRDITQAPVVNVPGATRIKGETRVVETPSTGGQWLLDQSYWRYLIYPAPVGVTLTSAIGIGADVDQVVVESVCIPQMNAVSTTKQLPDHSAVELSGPIVTRVFESFFYVQDPRWTGGIRVNCSGPLPTEGGTPTVLGTVETLDGERVIANAVVYGDTHTAPLKPVTMNLTAPMCGLNPAGLLARLYGWAQVPSPGSTVFTLDDGSPNPVRVELHGVSAPGDGKYVVVTGAIGADTSGPVLRVNQSDTIQEYQ